MENDNGFHLPLCECCRQPIAESPIVDEVDPGLSFCGIGCAVKYAELAELDYASFEAKITQIRKQAQVTTWGP